jgi:hypothetical protein
VGNAPPPLSGLAPLHARAFVLDLALDLALVSVLVLVSVLAFDLVLALDLVPAPGYDADARYLYFHPHLPGNSSWYIYPT